MRITVYLDERTYRALHRISSNTGRSIEDLAEAAIQNETSRTPEWTEVLPPGRRSLDEPAPHFSEARGLFANSYYPPRDSGL